MKTRILISMIAIMFIAISTVFAQDPPPNPPPRPDVGCGAVGWQFYTLDYGLMDCPILLYGDYQGSTLKYEVINMDGNIWKSHYETKIGPVSSNNTIVHDWFQEYPGTVGYVAYQITLTKSGCATSIGLVYVTVDH